MEAKTSKMGLGSAATANIPNRLLQYTDCGIKKQHNFKMLRAEKRVLLDSMAFDIKALMAFRAGKKLYQLLPHTKYQPSRPKLCLELKENENAIFRLRVMRYMCFFAMHNV